MVCRENKARSAVMGLLKRMMSGSGYSDYKDFEFQSAIHEYGHTFSAADNPTRQEYLDFLRGMRQQVINDQGINDQEKYRISHKQPGVVTRLDQEIKRVETGRDENGRPLRPEQINGGKHFQAMKHMSAILTRQQEAKQTYHETYARSMGVTVEQARARYNALTSLPVEERENTKISLTDNWRDNLRVNGIGAKTQADIGQSNEARFALAVMESERQAHINALPVRDAWASDAVSTDTYISSADADSMIRCEGCGQFGHEDSDCPNQKQVDDVNAAYDRLVNARVARDEYARAAQAGLVARLDDAESWQARAVYDEDGQTVRGYRTEDGQVVATREEWTEHTQSLADSYDAVKARAAMKEYHEASLARDEAVAALEKARGPVPKVSDAVVATKYNPETGALLVTRPGYTRKTDGVTMPPKDYLYLMGREEYAAFQASDSPGKFLSQSTGRAGSKGGNAPWKPANEAEAKALSRQVACPTCGQWTSMTSEHQCPVPGGRQGEVDAATAERARAARERAKLDSLPVNMADTTPRRLVQNQATGEIRGGRVSFPDPVAMRANADQGVVGIGGFSANYYGATVTGRAYTWTDPTTGERLFTARQATCSKHGNGRCEHIDKAADLMANHYASTRAYGVNPGNPLFRRDTEAAIDSSTYRNPTDESYEQIRERRGENAERTIANSAMNPNLRQAALYPRDADGTPVRWPSTYTAPGGRAIRVDDDGEAAATAITSQLQERTGRQWVAQPDGRGGYTITAPSWRRTKDGLNLRDRLAISQTFGVRARGSRSGYHVPNDSSWRHEALSRAYGQEPSIRGAQRVMGLRDAPGPDA